MLSLIATLCFAVLPDVSGFTKTQGTSVTLYTCTAERNAVVPQPTRKDNYDALRAMLSVAMPVHVGLCQACCTEDQKKGSVYALHISDIDKVGPEAAAATLLQAIREGKAWAGNPNAVTVFTNFQDYQYKASRAPHSEFRGFCVHPKPEETRLVALYASLGFTVTISVAAFNYGGCQEMFLPLEAANALLEA